MKNISRWLLIIPAILLSTVINVLIVSVVSQTVLIQLITYGVEKHIALAIAIVVAVSTYCYISFYYLIREFIRKGSRNE